MDFNSVGNVLGMAYQYASRTQKTTASGTSFTESLQGAAKADTSNVDVYTEYLKSKYADWKEEELVYSKWKFLQ